ncbi:MAG: hypothetical protein AABW71_05370 [Nanoarchaeota archaeon]
MDEEFEQSLGIVTRLALAYHESVLDVAMKGRRPTKVYTEVSLPPADKSIEQVDRKENGYLRILGANLAMLYMGTSKEVRNQTDVANLVDKVETFIRKHQK